MTAGLKIASIVLWLGGAHAASPQGIDLARDCRGADAVGQARCTAFISGFTTGSQVNFNGRFFNDWRYGDHRWCFEEAVPNDALIKTFLDYAAAHTGELHFPAAMVFAKALAAKYQCR